MFAHSTWTKFQTQLHLHNRILLCLNTLSVLPLQCCQSAPNPTEDSDFVVHLCLIFVGLTCGNLRGKDHNATLRHLSMIFQKSLLSKIFDNSYILHIMLLTGWPSSTDWNSTRSVPTTSGQPIWVFQWLIADI